MHSIIPAVLALAAAPVREGAAPVLNPKVHVSTVMVADLAPGAVDSILAQRAPQLGVFHDPKCGSCTLFPEDYWDRMRRGMARTGASAKDLAKVGTMPGSPSWIVIDGTGKKYAGEGMPLGMTMDQLGAALAHVVDEAGAGHLSRVASPRIDWKALPEADRDRARAVARDQLLRWNNMSDADADAMLAALIAG